MYYNTLNKKEKALANKWMEKIRRLADEDKEICYWLMLFFECMKDLQEAKEVYKSLKI